MDSRTKLNVGLIGLGRLGRVYARTLATRVPGIRLTAVADVDAAAVEQAGEELDVERRSTDPADVFGDPAVDAVVIVTPTSTHRAIVEGAAAAGKAIFCEKPLSISLDEAIGAPAGTGTIRGVLSDGLPAPVRSRVRGGQAAARRRRHRRRGRVQVHLARSLPALGRIRGSAHQRRPDHRHGHPRLRHRPLVHGRRRRRPGDRRPARVSRARRASATSTTRSSA